MTARTIHQAIEHVLATGRKVPAICPAHDDSSPSLSVAVGDNQPIVLNCFAGCQPEDILLAAKLTWDDISSPRDPEPLKVARSAQRPVKVYDYVDEDGTLLYQQRRYASPKWFMPRHEVSGGWLDGLGDRRRVPYRLPELIAAIKARQPVWYVEGERDVDTLSALGVVATTTVNGAKSWKEEYAPFFRGATLNVIADADEPGRALAAKVYATCSAVGARVRVFECTKGKDITEHLANGGGHNDLTETITARGYWKVWTRPEIESYVPPPNQWVIEDTLARGERAVITASEGGGKSEMLRHLALCASVGIHPFSLAPVEPRKVLLVDGENSKADVNDSWNWLFSATSKLGHPDLGLLNVIMLSGAGDGAPDDGPTVPPDLAEATGRADLIRNIELIRPDLVCIGPLYKLVTAELTENTVRALIGTIDQARSICGSAFVIEHHAPHGASGKDRDLRPLGSSILRRWPNFGFALVQRPSDAGEKLYDWKPWRGARKRDRLWPTLLREGRPGTLELPWMGTEDVEHSVPVRLRSV